MQRVNYVMLHEMETKYNKIPLREDKIILEYRSLNQELNLLPI